MSSLLVVACNMCLLLKAIVTDLLLYVMPWKCEPAGKSTRAIHQRLVMGATRCLSSPQLSDLLLNLTYIPVGLQHLPVFSTNTKAKAGLRQAQRRCRYRLYYSVFQTASSHWQASLSKQRSFNFFNLVLRDKLLMSSQLQGH